MNTLVQHLALNADPESQVAEHYRQTDGRKDGRHDDANSRSYYWVVCTALAVYDRLELEVVDVVNYGQYRTYCNLIR